MTINVGVIGCGNMAEALVPLLLVHEDVRLHLYNRTFEKANNLANSLGQVAYKSIQEFPECEYYLIAVKPQQFSEMAKEVSDFLAKDSTVISIMAAIDIDILRSRLGKDKDYVRMMPNVASQVAEGVLTFFFENSVPDARQEHIVELFGACGEIFVLDSEELLDEITPYTGSGAAYFFYFTDLMAEDLKKRGISSRSADAMAKKIMIGAAKLLESSDLSCCDLISQVTSKRGVTECVLKNMNDLEISKRFYSSIEAGVTRASELKKAVLTYD